MARSDVAIIGMAGRFPGAPDLAAYWRNLRDGVESITFLSDADLEAADIDPRWRSSPAYVRAAAVLPDIESFDAERFGIPASVAVVLDPQQRLLLECAVEALEDAGRAPGTDSGAIGVYVGGRFSEYLSFHQDPIDLAGLGPGSPVAAFQRLLANDKDFLATRISYRLDLQGPSVSVQSACSTSLVAVHLAVQALLAGECDVALAGAACVRVPQRAGYPLAEGMIFSPDGHTRPFDARAAGTLFGSGVGLVALRRLGDALADRDRVRAVIRGTAVNNDGAEGKAFFSAPSASGQARVIAEALEVAGVAPAEISYVEAHGTGTPLGDPIEVEALTRAFGRVAGRRGSCGLGSVKGNVGHLVQAAGIAGLIKTVLMLEHREQVPSLHFERPNPRIDFASGPFSVVSERRPWDAAGPRRAGVSSFGMGGTNAHVVLEEAPAREAQSVANDRSHHVLCLSARTPESLSQLARCTAEVLSAPDAPVLADAAFTSHMGRPGASHRLAVVAEDSAAAARALRAGPLPTVVPPAAPAPRIAFLFSGQGAQYAGMGRQLAETAPEFRIALDACAAVLDPRLDRRLRAILDAEELLARTDYAQPALVALGYALAVQWRSWGLVPGAVVGHSVGELAGAVVAGRLPLDEALRFAVERGRLMQRAAASGAMAAVALDAVRTAALLPDDGSLSLAALNGPRQTVVAGRRADVEALLAGLERDGVPAHLLPGPGFHSPLLDPILDELEQAAPRADPQTAALAFVSTLHGRALGPGESLDALYWRRQAREPVRFAAALAAARALGCDVFLEVGPAPVLSVLAASAFPGEDIASLPTLRPGRSEWQALLETLAALYGRGTAIDWKAFDAPWGRSRVGLPTTPFERRRHWIDRPRRTRSAPVIPAGHPLLGRRVASPLAAAQFESTLSATSPAFLAGHVIFDEVIVPSTAFVEMLRAALGEIDPSADGAAVLEEVVIRQPLPLPPGHRHRVQVVCSREEGGVVPAQIFSRDDDADPSTPWTLHVTARLSRARRSAEPRSIREVQERCVAQDVAEFYRIVHTRGTHPGPDYQGVAELWTRPGEAVARVELPANLLGDGGLYGLHPAQLDACLQAMIAADPREGALLPVCWDRVVVHDRLPATTWTLATATAPAEDLRLGEMTLCDETGRVLVEVTGVHFKRASPASLHRRNERPPALHVSAWMPSPLGPVVSDRPWPRTWLVLADQGGTGTALAARLRAAGCRVEVATAPAPDAAVDRAVALASDPAWEAIVHLWSLDLPPVEAVDAGAVHDWEAGQALAFGSLLEFARTAATQPRPPRLFVVSRGACDVDAAPRRLAPFQATAPGLGRVLTRELPALFCTTVDLDPDGVVDDEGLWGEVCAAGGAGWVAWRAGCRYEARLERGPAATPAGSGGGARDSPAPPFRLGVIDPGSFDSLVPAPAVRRAPNPGEVEIEVRATGVNFKDALIALGRFAGPPGYDCSGVIVACGAGVTGLAVGEEVFAIARDSFASFVTVPVTQVARRPARLDFVQAAAVPATFATARHAFDAAALKSGETVLIHAAAGGVGHAAVQLARARGAIVFATASRAKWPYLRALGVDHVFDSRAATFAAPIRALTGGRGVDVVLNSLAGELLSASIDLLATGGRFIEIGAPADWDAGRFAAVRPDARYIRFLLLDVIQADPAAFQASLRQLGTDFDAGRLAPPPVRAFDTGRASAALRFLGQGHAVGRVAVVNPPPARPLARPGASYVITGGQGALGLHTARWLAGHGAGQLLLVSRHGTLEAEATADQLRRSGTQVRLEQLDVADAPALAALFADLEREGLPVRGVVHAAGVLDDGLIAAQSWARGREVLRPKLAGAWNLHRLTAGRELDHFILFSSVSGVWGNPGQAAYAAANAFLDALAHYRRSRGLPACSADWGPWAGSGMAARVAEPARRRREQRGLHEIAPAAAFRGLEAALAQNLGQALIAEIDWTAYRVGAPPMPAAFLSALQPEPAPVAKTRRPAAARPAQLLREEVGRALGLDPAALDEDASLVALGLDSLMVIELRHRLQTALGLDLSMSDFLAGPSLRWLAERLERGRDGKA